jgi:hypothetical protein
MNLSVLIIIISVANLLISFSFTSLYFKNGINALFVKASVLFLTTVWVLSLTGWFLGNYLSGLLTTISIKAGAALFMVLCIKSLIRALKTKSINRIFDISQIKTLIGLLFIMNIDLFLAWMASGLIWAVPLQTFLIWLTVSSFFGLLLGGLTGKKFGFLLPNLIDALIALLFGSGALLALLS